MLASAGSRSGRPAGRLPSFTSTSASAVTAIPVSANVRVRKRQRRPSVDAASAMGNMKKRPSHSWYFTVRDTAISQ